jgi:hypothetical protein
VLGPGKRAEEVARQAGVAPPIVMETLAVAAALLRITTWE